MKLVCASFFGSGRFCSKFESEQLECGEFAMAMNYSGDSRTNRLRGALTGLLAALTVVQAVADEALLEYVMTKQEEARAGLPSFSVTINRELTQSVRVGDRALYHEAFNGSITRIEQNGSMFAYRTGQTAIRGETTPTGTVEGASNNSRSFLEQHFMVQNPNYIAAFRMHDANTVADLSIREYKSLDSITREAEGSRESALGQADLLGHAFGIYGFIGGAPSIRDAVRTQSGPEMEWNAERQQGANGEIFLVTLRNTRVGESPLLTATIDPAKGLMTTSCQYTPPARKDRPVRAYNYSVGAKEVKPGVWFPTELHVSDSIPRGAETLLLEVKDVVSALEIEPQIPNDTFSWRALNYPGGKVFVHDPEGNVEVCDVVDGNLVPDPRFNKAADQERDVDRLIDGLNQTLELSLKKPDDPPIEVAAAPQTVAPAPIPTSANPTPAPVQSAFPTWVVAAAVATIVALVALFAAWRNKRIAR